MALPPDREEFRAFVAERLRQELSSAERRLLDSLASWEPPLPVPNQPASRPLSGGVKTPSKQGDHPKLVVFDTVCPGEPLALNPPSGSRKSDILTIDPGGKLSPDTPSTSDEPAPACREAWASSPCPPQSQFKPKASRASIAPSGRLGTTFASRLTQGFSMNDRRSPSDGRRPMSAGGRSKKEVNITVGSFLRSTTTLDTSNGKVEDEWESHGDGFRAIVANVVLSQNFDFVSAALIIANALSIGTQTDYMARTQSEFLPLPLRIIEVSFCIAFGVELCLRLYVFRLRFFYMQGSMWNIMDFVLVLLQVTEELVAIILDLIGASADESSIGGTAPSLLRLLRILRLVRVLRVMRVLRFIGELRSLVISLLGCMRPFFWTLVLLFLVLYLFAVYFTQLVLNHRAESGEPTPDLDKFGSLFVSLIVLYQCMTGGLDWEEAVNPLVHDISPLVGVIFVFYIAFTSLAMTNVLTGIFVESALLRAKEDRELVIERNARELFSKVDVNGDGDITWVEFEKQLMNKEVKEYFQLIDMNIVDARGIFTLLDLDGNGVVDAEEFLNGCLQLRRPAKSLDLFMLSFETRQVFQAQHSQINLMDGKVTAVFDALKAPHGPLKEAKTSGFEFEAPLGWA